MGAVLLALAGTPAAAQTATDGTSQPDEEAVITVTGSRLATDVEELPTAVSILDAEDLSDQFAVSTDLLRALDVTVPGLTLSTGDRSQCRTNIRGRRPSFQINGVPANQDLRPSNCNSAFQVSPFALERIEVVRGATALFGAGSPGGIINLITRRARGPELEVDAVAQTSFNTSEPSGTLQTDLYLGAGQQVGAFDYYAGIAYQDYGVGRDPNGGRVPGTAFTSVGLNGSLGWEVTPDLRLRFTGTHYDEDPGEEFGVSGADVDAGVDRPRVIPVVPNPFQEQERDRQTTLALSLAADDLLGQRLQASAFYQWQQFRQRANFQEFNAGNPDFFNDDRTNSTAGLRLTLAADFAAGPADIQIEYGIDYQRNELIRLLLASDDPSEVVGFIAPEVILNTTGLFVQADAQLGAVRLTGGVRQEYYSGEIGDERAGEGLSGEGTPGPFADADITLINAGIVYDLAPRFQLYASYNQGAEITQLGRAARRATDPGLISPEPAISEQYELGARGSLGPVRVTAAAFYSESEAASLLQADPSCAGQSFCPLIPLRVPQRVWGAEATLDWRITPTVAVGGVFTWQEGEIFNEDEQRFIPFSADTVSPTRFTIFGDVSPARGLTARAQATYIAETDFFSVSEQEGLGLIDTPSVFLVDASVAYRLDPVEISLGIANLLDNDYENVTQSAAGFSRTLAEGRRVTLTLRSRF